MKNLILLLLFLTVTFCYSQTNEDAKNYVKQGIDLVDAGKIDEGIALYKKALEIDPKNTFFNYELAYAYYLQQKYDKVITVLEKVKNNPDTFDQVFAVLGNAYDISGDRDKALKTYKAGLKKFPNSGKIYLELGVVSMSEKEYEEALKYFEKGIRAEPTHPSNYYWASVFYSGSDVPMWGLIYGEIFLNLEQNTKRAETISKMMYKVYGDKISITDSGGKKNASIKLNKFNNGKGFDSEFEMNAMLASFGLLLDSTFTGMNLNGINKFRINFLDMWFSSEKTKNNSNVLFDYHKTLKDKGLFEAYNYYLFAYGNIDEFNTWAAENKDKVKEFDDWFSNYGINLTKENVLYRKFEK